MRLTSQFFIAAIMRQADLKMGFAAVLKKGAAEAGAILIIHRLPNGQLDLYGPAMQNFYDDNNSRERCFEARLKAVSEDAIREFIEKEQRFDPDIWVIELEVTAHIFTSLIQLADES